ncbi:ATP-binding protein [Bacteroidota bacterium]
MYPREIALPLNHWLGKNEIIILYGARQVGKTTLLREILKEKRNAIILNCELPTVADILESKDLSQIKALFEDNSIIALDEAQKITNIGSILKLVYDELPQYKLIATGSSSFELASRISEPLTGRNIKFRLYPLSLNEVKQRWNWLWINENFNNLIIYGTYPGIMDLSVSDKQSKLSELASDYLFKDVLMYENIKNPALIRKLLKALALQTGSQVSYNELSGLLGVSRATIEKYTDLLEKNFVIYSLPSYSSNLRNEIKKSRKFFFYDTGIRNALIGDFKPLENRVDAGALWENFCISQRIIFNSVAKSSANTYFWRTYDGAEIDLVEEYNGSLSAFEFKMKLKGKGRIPESFVTKYEPVKTKIISPSNLFELLD